MADWTDLRDECDFIRFETLLYWVEDNYRNIDFLEFLEAYNNPSALQQSIVDFAINGATIITPNFDDLLERAYIKAGMSPTTIDAHHVPDTTMPFGAGYVIKLHHSWFYHSSGSFTRSVQPISATMDVIIRESPGGRLNEKASEVLKHSVDGRKLITIGYSASDAIDIVPALFECSPREVHWVNYSDSTCTAYDWSEYLGVRPVGPPATWERLVQCWHDGGTAIHVYCGRAEEALGHIGMVYTPFANTRDDFSWRKTIREWAKAVRRHDPTGLGLAALLFGEMEFYGLSDKAMRQSFGYKDRTCGWSSAKRLYEIAQNAYLKSGAEYHKIIKLAKHAKAEARRISDDWVLEAALILEGRCYFHLRKWDKALCLFSSSEIDRSGYLFKGACKLWIGRTMVWSGYPRRARKILVSACRYLQRNGDIDSLVDAEFTLGVAALNMGKLFEAKGLLADNSETCHLHGLLAQQGYALTELSHADYLIGDFASARSSIDRAIAILGDAGNDETSTAHSVLADIEFLDRHYSECIKCSTDALSSSTATTDYLVSENLSKKAAGELLLNKVAACDATLLQIESLPESKCNSLGLMITSCLKFCRGRKTKNDLNKEIMLSRLNASQRIVLAILCSRLNIECYKVRILIEKAASVLATEHICYWRTEIHK
jgi:tetratricopeptide (TPR) repeat protein